MFACGVIRGPPPQTHRRLHAEAAEHLHPDAAKLLNDAP